MIKDMFMEYYFDVKGALTGASQGGGPPRRVPCFTPVACRHRDDLEMILIQYMVLFRCEADELRWTYENV